MAETKKQPRYCVIERLLDGTQKKQMHTDSAEAVIIAQMMLRLAGKVAWVVDLEFERELREGFDVKGEK